jgi:hypothetical protein
MKCEHFDTSDRSGGYVETVGNGLGATHHAVTFEVVEFTTAGNVRRKVRLRLDLYDAAKIAKLVQLALNMRDDHTQRLRNLAAGQGY